MITQEQINAKLIQIQEFENEHGTDHGIASVNAMKRYCLDANYRKRVKQFNKASINTIKHYSRL
jgi:hypothetical protein